MGKDKYRIPILANKHFRKPSVFNPANLLKQARRQKLLLSCSVPEICVLDPDGDLSSYIRDSSVGKRNPCWACYHTDLYNVEIEGLSVGVVGRAVGASFAVLVAEELFASGCRLLISITSAGQIKPVRKPPYFILIDRALRDEGTSYHYMQESAYAYIFPDILAMLNGIIKVKPLVVQGAVWTTDAPFRETKEAISFARLEGLLAVEMEAAALYAFAQARKKKVVCFAHVTNQMGMIDKDFEKGKDNGNAVLLQLISNVICECKKAV
ncbi:MAG: uridine phosphorylase [Candidatus Omnitrophica bacterium CG11_big_fil_rev_8_21_14_0_20_41_12]|nr:MAG: uridine phosphorylase [Candidatus Omnitrophica bacterium CG11_big_fil_rev_8_21_14_0_20_41_12]